MYRDRWNRKRRFGLLGIKNKPAQKNGTKSPRTLRIYASTRAAPDMKSFFFALKMAEMTDLGSIEKIHEISRSQAELRTVFTVAREALPREMIACEAATERLLRSYGVKVSASRVFKALVELGSSRQTGNEWWCTDEFVLWHSTYEQMVRANHLRIKPDAADYMTAIALDDMQATRMLARLAYPPKSAVLTHELFDGCEALQRCLTR
ncbi:hypothetical protein HII31_07348 [Pseudocercospora fuligena]|uniref:Uncharacterized protein n=1 Tax=Pseudocercospora fuligena TaxID=685502 RepID=A0A8H6RGA6_9PEZI|nr:hypothetical protein HII31_07348 [Pseudocercospora fuligena]